MRYNLYTEIIINISRREADDSNKIVNIAQKILRDSGGHEKDIISFSRDKEHPFMKDYKNLESVWRCRFVTKNIQNRHKKIFEELKLKFSDRNIYCPYEESGWRLFLTRLESNICTIVEFIENINTQRLTKKEEKIFQEIKRKYNFAFDSSKIQHSIQNIVRKKTIGQVFNQLNITPHLKRLENNPEIDTNEPQKAVDNLLDILNVELFISQFEWIYKEINKSWEEKYDWVLFKEHDIFDCLKIPKDDREFHFQIENLYKIFVESLSNKEFKVHLQKLPKITRRDVTDEKGNWKKSIDLLNMWFIKSLKKNNHGEFIEFLKLLHNLRGKIAHNLQIEKIPQLEELKKVVKFCKKKQSIDIYHGYNGLFKGILKTSEILLDELKQSIN